MLVQGTGGNGSGLSAREPDGVNFHHTPNTTGMDGGSNSRRALAKRQQRRPSPTCSDVYTGNLKSTQQKPGSMHSVTLPQAVAMWPTPNASDDRDRGNMSNPCVQRRAEIGKQLMLSQVVDPNSGALNPQWVSWLMGWPIGWADVAPLGELDWRDWSVDPADIGEVPRVTSVKENRANQLKALGNGQVPACVVKAWELLA